ncbi:MAG: hypothetical protein Q7T11_08620, partial [Deltaproteobacteria bacterium]|nr:hypothetical protein [Deltaproteobacteria bacterium]
LPDKIQVLDVSNPEQVSVLFEIPLGGASQAYPYGGTVYVAADRNLHVAASSDMTVKSMVPVGVTFKILGVREEEGRLTLVLALKSAVTGRWNTLQFLPLIAGGGGIADQGSSLKIGEADEIFGAASDPYLLFLRAGGMALFDLKARKETALPAGLGEGKNPLAGAMAGEALFVSSQNGLARFENAAAASPQKKIPLAGNIVSLAMTSAGNMVAVNADGRVFLASGIEEGGAFHELSLPAGTEISYAKYSDAGIGLVGKNPKIFILSADLAQVTPLDGGKGMIGFDTVAANENYLLLTALSKTGVAYFTHDLKTAKRVGSLSLPDIGGIKILDSTRALAACGKEGGCLIDLGPPMKVAAKIPSIIKDGTAIEAGATPDGKTGLLFFEQEGGAFISLVDLKAQPPAEISRILQLPMTREQFRGATFAAGGRKLILPQDYGIAVYDLSNPSNPVLSFKWPVGKAYASDVTGRGKILCVALGEKGIECGKFSEAPPYQAVPPATSEESSENQE